MPWEELTARGARLRRRLGHFRGPILSLLERDPTQRPSMVAFKRTCHSVLLSTTNQLTVPDL